MPKISKLGNGRYKIQTKVSLQRLLSLITILYCFSENIALPNHLLSVGKYCWCGKFISNVSGTTLYISEYPSPGVL